MGLAALFVKMGKALSRSTRISPTHRCVFAGEVAAISLVIAHLLGGGFASAAERGGGYLLIIGGGERPKDVSELLIQLAGGAAGARLVVISLASEDAVGSGRSAVDDFKTLGVSRVEVLPDALEAAARAVQRATGVYFTGGDQQRLVSALAGTPVLDALHQLWRRGGVIAGISAGAAAMSARMITGEELGIAKEDERFRSIQRGHVATTNGFGFLTNAIVDQHFIARKRVNRLFSVVLEEPGLLGIGVDESTAVVVSADQRLEVLGERSVMVIDARHAGPVRVGANQHLAATDLRVHILVAGDRFDLKRGRPIPRSR
jgi:cyanophycinase